MPGFARRPAAPLRGCGASAVGQDARHYVQATVGGWTPAATWAYDNAGNRTSENDNGNVTAYTANNLNQYTAINTAAPTYNANGDLLTDQSRSYVWNGRSQMTSVTTGSVTETHNFDALGRRIARTDASGTIYFIHDGWNVIAEYKRISAANVLQRRYVWGEDLSGSLQGAGGVGGLVVAEEISGTTSTPYSYHYDGNGNVVEITDASAAVVASYRYDAYGKTLNVTGSYAASNRYRFSTKPVELASGLYFYGYRFYDPANGRWTTRDPIHEADSANLYIAVLNDLVDSFDVLGMEAQKVNCGWKLVLGHLGNEALDELDKWLDNKPKGGYPGSDCGNNKIGFSTCGSGYMNGAVPSSNRLPVNMNDNADEKMNDKDYNDVRDAAKKRGLPAPPRSIRYRYDDPTTDNKLIDQLFLKAIDECRNKKTCCSSVTITVSCTKGYGIGPDGKSIAKTMGVRDPCSQSGTIDCSNIRK